MKRSKYFNFAAKKKPFRDHIKQKQKQKRKKGNNQKSIKFQNQMDGNSFEANYSDNF